jgi:hypothetical protein
MTGGSAAHQEDDALDGVVGDDVVRRIGPSPTSEKMARRRCCGPSQFDCLCTVTKSMTVITVVVTAGLGVAPVDGGDRCL